MKAFGLTGNIGCGKSTVASLLSKYPDVLVLDCDSIAKNIISDNANKTAINTTLGTDVFASGKVDFKAIAEIIFIDPSKKTSFESYIHPLVWSAVQEKVNLAGAEKICIVESAIIYETSSEDKFAATIVATCNPAEQIRRLRENRKMNILEIQARIRQQLPSIEKEKRAQFVVQTNCNLAQLIDTVHTLYHNLKQWKNTQQKA